MCELKAVLVVMSGTEELWSNKLKLCVLTLVFQSWIWAAAVVS